MRSTIRVFASLLVLLMAVAVSSACGSKANDEEAAKAKAQRQLAEQQRGERAGDRIRTLQAEVNGLEIKIKDIQLQNNQTVADLQAANRQLGLDLSALQSDLGLSEMAAAPAADADNAAPKIQVRITTKVPGAKTGAADSGAPEDASHPIASFFAVIVILAVIFFIVKVFLDRMTDEDEPFFDEGLDDADENVRTDLGTVTLTAEARNAQQAADKARGLAAASDADPDEEK